MNANDRMEQDFESMTHKSGDRVFELLKGNHISKDCSNDSNLKQSNPPSATGNFTANCGLDPVGENEPLAKRLQNCKPSAVLNVRIPQELSDLIDDRVYRSKKQGKPQTKQEIAIRALTVLLAADDSCDTWANT